MDISPQICFNCKQFAPSVTRDERGRPVLVYCKHSMTGCERLNKYIKGEKK